MGTYGFVAVCLGASLGVSLRWWLGHRLNPIFPALPIGTLVVNLLRGCLVGAAVAFFKKHSGPPSATRLAIITGFFGVLNPDEEDPPSVAQESQGEKP